jgi:hypothetical protein
MILVARMRRDEMMRESDKDKLAARVLRAARHAARTAQAADRPALRLVAPSPTATGR